MTEPTWSLPQFHTPEFYLALPTRSDPSMKPLDRPSQGAYRYRCRNLSPARPRARLSHSRHRIPDRHPLMRKCEAGRLMPPLPTRNFAISPPASPPDHWVSFEEDGPNMMPHAEDIAARLQSLTMLPQSGEYCVFDPSVHYVDSESDGEASGEAPIYGDERHFQHHHRSTTPDLALHPEPRALDFLPPVRSAGGPVEPALPALPADSPAAPSAGPLHRRGFVIPPIFVTNDDVAEPEESRGRLRGSLPAPNLLVPGFDGQAMRPAMLPTACPPRTSMPLM